MDWFNVAWEKVRKGPKKWFFLVGGAITGAGLATNRMNCKYWSSFCDTCTIASLSAYSIFKNIEVKNKFNAERKKSSAIWNEKEIVLRNQLDDALIFQEKKDWLTIKKIQEEKDKLNDLQKNMNKFVNISHIIQSALSGYSIIIHLCSNLIETEFWSTFFGILNVTILFSFPAQCATHSLVASYIGVKWPSEENISDKKIWENFLKEYFYPEILSISEDLNKRAKEINEKINEASKFLEDKRSLVSKYNTRLGEIKVQKSEEFLQEKFILEKEIISLRSEIEKKWELKNDHVDENFSLTQKLEKVNAILTSYGFFQVNRTADQNEISAVQIYPFQTDDQEVDDEKSIERIV